jgi:hypothetical protein
LSFVLRLSRLTSHVSFLTLLFVLLALAFAGPAFSQQRWERNYGGTGDDLGYSVQQTQDGGYIVAGDTSYYLNDYQVYLIKTNASGDTLWTKTYGGASDDGGYSVQQTQDTGYIVAGYTWSFGNARQVYLIKTNASGDTLWTRTYGGANIDFGYSAQQTSDTGYIVAGTTNSFGNSWQVYLVKTNASGDTLWTRNYGGTGDDWGFSVQQTQDTGYIVAGTTSSFGDSVQVYLVKTNASGDTLWTRTYGGGRSDVGFSVQQTQDRGYIVAGYTYSFGNLLQFYLIKTNASGDTLWTRTYGGASYDYGRSVQQTSDGGYIVAGETSSFGNGFQVYLIKTNAGGDTLWTRNYGGTSDDAGCSVQQTQDLGYIIGGGTNSFGNYCQVYLIKTDSLGNSSGVEGGTGGSRQKAVGSLKATPNPFTSFATLPGHSFERFALYDISGRKVGTYRGDRIGEGLSAGVYFLKPESGDAKPFRIVKLR